MNIDWKNGDKSESVLFARQVSYPGIEAFHHRVLAGELRDQTIDCHEINVNLFGEIRVRKQNPVGFRTSHVSSPGSVCLSPSGASVGADWSDQLELLSLCFVPGFLDRVAAENGFSGGYELVEDHRENDRVVQHLGLALVHETGESDPTDGIYADSLSQTLAVHILKNYSTAAAKQQKKGGLSGYRLRAVRDFINDNLENELTLGEMAEVAGLSRFHFTRAFRKSTGRTPRQYVIEKRVERAKQLLSRSDIPIVEVVFQTGFKNQSHFTSLFRRLTSITPAVWRSLERG
ncbi:MAG: AraC family transcriptional regulator [Pyrinomonadaceae bacterium]